MVTFQIYFAEQHFPVTPFLLHGNGLGSSALLLCSGYKSNFFKQVKWEDIFESSRWILASIKAFLCSQIDTSQPIRNPSNRWSHWEQWKIFLCLRARKVSYWLVLGLATLTACKKETTPNVVKVCVMFDKGKLKMCLLCFRELENNCTFACLVRINASIDPATVSLTRHRAQRRNNLIDASYRKREDCQRLYPSFKAFIPLSSLPKRFDSS